MQKPVPARRLALFRRGTLALLLSALAAPALGADSQASESIAPAVSYADLADLAGPAAVVVKAQVRKVAEVEPERAAGLRAGWARLYIEARTEAVLGGKTALGEALRYLADVPRDAKGKVPKLSKRSVILFARPVAGRPGELQLVAPDAQLLWDLALEARVKALLGEFYAPSAPRAISGRRDATRVPGAGGGEGERQYARTTAGGEPAAVTGTRAPGSEPRWAVSFSELVETGAPPPARETLAWYRLACFLPRQLVPGANVSSSPEDRQAAARDYRFVLEQLGPCPRLRR